MTIQEHYVRDVREKNCAACDIADADCLCFMAVTCGKESECFQPMGFEAYAKAAARDNGLPVENASKFDGGKLEIDLVPVQIIRDIAEVRMYGTKKYGSADNWRKVELRRYINALLRHTLEFLEDAHSVDEESGIPHYKHMACNLAFISQHIAEEKNGK